MDGPKGASLVLDGVVEMRCLLLAVLVSIELDNGHL